MEEILNKFKNEYPDYKIIFLTKFGSHLYGFSNENSDTDIKGVFVPSAEDMLTKTDIDHWSYSTGNKDAKNTKDDIDVELFSIHKYLDMLSRGITVALDIHFAESNPDCYIQHDNKLWSDIVQKHGSKLISRNLKSFFGYCVGQSSKYGLKGIRLTELKDFISFLEGLHIDKQCKVRQGITAIEMQVQRYQYIKLVNLEGITYVHVLGKNYLLDIVFQQLLDFCKGIENRYGKRAESAVSGVDLKALSHSFRILDESEELMTTGKITFPVKNAKYIKDLRDGLVDTDEAFILLHSKLDELNALEKTSKNILPFEVDLGLKSKIVLEMYKYM